MSYGVVEQPRTLIRNDAAFVPQCPVTACKRTATHEVKRGPKWVARGCAPHAYELCAFLNDGVDMERALNALR